jgi:demethylmenaquinone methyltransferase/2-methoxy-6-polyprenyl-1,4-benzoquinol methylase/phosphoethanolamine N-methyltransferase
MHVHHANTKTGRVPATTGNVIHWARAYDPFVSLLLLGQRGRLRAMTVDLAGITPGATVLEVGCGTGDVAISARARAGSGAAVYGIDPAPEMIAVARDKAERGRQAVDFQVGVIEALAFPDASFDVVISSLMMHHLPDDLKPRGLAEVLRVLKPGGKLLIVDVKHPTGWLGQALNVLLLHGGVQTGIQDMPALLQAAGFDTIETGPTAFPMLGFARGYAPR